MAEREARDKILQQLDEKCEYVLCAKSYLHQYYKVKTCELVDIQYDTNQESRNVHAHLMFADSDESYYYLTIDVVTNEIYWAEAEGYDSSDSV